MFEEGVSGDLLATSGKVSSGSRGPEAEHVRQMAGSLAQANARSPPVKERKAEAPLVGRERRLAIIGAG